MPSDTISSFTLDPKHLAAFIRAAKQHRGQGRVGRNLRRWTSHLRDEGGVPEELPDSAVTRDELRRFCLDPHHSNTACFCAIMAWGGMQAGHARRALQHRVVWGAALAQLRTDARLDRVASFDLLLGQRRNGTLPGVRAAFFTKLIFFLLPAGDGYIMDQWTAKSVNLVCDRPIVRLNPQGYVTDENTSSDYAAFCCAIEAIAAAWPSPPKPCGAEVEEWMMSVGGRRPGLWRSYVKNHFPKVS